MRYVYGFMAALALTVAALAVNHSIVSPAPIYAEGEGDDHDVNGEILFFNVDTQERIPSCQIHGNELYRFIKGDKIQVFTPEGDRLCRYRVVDTEWLVVEREFPQRGICWGSPSRGNKVRLVVHIHNVD